MMKYRQQNILVLLMLIFFEFYHPLVGQMMISYGMRRLALSLNQFGLDMLRIMEQFSPNSISTRTESSLTSYAFCPFCIGSSLAMLMAGLGHSRESLLQDLDTTESLYESLRYALYVNSMQQQEINLAFLDLMRHLQVNLPEGFRIRKRSISSDSNPDQTIKNCLNIINQVYVQRYLPIDYRYYGLIQQYYQTPIRTLDFAYAAEESRQHINAMVERATNEKIQNLINRDQDNSTHQLSMTRLLFLTGLYFEARLDFRQLSTGNRNRRGAFQRLWPLRSPLFQMPHLMVHTHQQLSPNRPYVAFKPWLANQTTTQSSTVVSTLPTMASSSTGSILYQIPISNSISVSNPQHTFDPFKPFRLPSKPPMRTANKESIRLRYQHNSYLNTTVVEMPFAGGIVSLLVLLPDTPDSMELMLSRLNAQLIIYLLQSLEIQRVDITVPLINISYSVPNLQKVFTTMGLSKIFDQMGSNSFAGIETFPLSQTMQIYHKIVMNIDVLDDENQFNFIETSRTKKSFDYPLDRSKLSSFEITSPTMRILSTKEEKYRNQQSQEGNTFQTNKGEIKRKHISLEEETFIYLIIDNISGLVLAMGKHQS